nr:uncharacterized protein LOC109181091 [Ipomoea batatas]GME09838.1 uncharacterized protein LOC109181091 [Ipomoea batatas]
MAEPPVAPPAKRCPATAKMPEKRSDQIAEERVRKSDQKKVGATAKASTSLLERSKKKVNRKLAMDVPIATENDQTKVIIDREFIAGDEKTEEEPSLEEVPIEQGGDENPKSDTHNQSEKDDRTKNTVESKKISENQESNQEENRTNLEPALEMLSEISHLRSQMLEEEYEKMSANIREFARNFVKEKHDGTVESPNVALRKGILAIADQFVRNTELKKEQRITGVEASVESNESGSSDWQEEFSVEILEEMKGLCDVYAKARGGFKSKGETDQVILEIIREMKNNSLMNLKGKMVQTQKEEMKEREPNQKAQEKESTPSVCANAPMGYNAQSEGKMIDNELKMRGTLNGGPNAPEKNNKQSELLHGNQNKNSFGPMPTPAPAAGIGRVGERGRTQTKEGPQSRNQSRNRKGGQTPQKEQASKPNQQGKGPVERQTPRRYGQNQNFNKVENRNFDQNQAWGPPGRKQGGFTGRAGTYELRLFEAIILMGDRPCSDGQTAGREDRESEESLHREGSRPSSAPIGSAVVCDPLRKISQSIDGQKEDDRPSLATASAMDGVRRVSGRVAIAAPRTAVACDPSSEATLAVVDLALDDRPSSLRAQTSAANEGLPSKPELKSSAAIRSSQKGASADAGAQSDLERELIHNVRRCLGAMRREGFRFSDEALRAIAAGDPLPKPARAFVKPIVGALKSKDSLPRRAKEAPPTEASLSDLEGVGKVVSVSTESRADPMAASSVCALVKGSVAAERTSEMVVKARVDVSTDGVPFADAKTGDHCSPKVAMCQVAQVAPLTVQPLSAHRNAVAAGVRTASPGSLVAGGGSVAPAVAPFGLGVDGVTEADRVALESAAVGPVAVGRSLDGGAVAAPVRTAAGTPVGDRSTQAGNSGVSLEVSQPTLPPAFDNGIDRLPKLPTSSQLNSRQSLAPAGSGSMSALGQKPSAGDRALRSGLAAVPLKGGMNALPLTSAERKLPAPLSVGSVGTAKDPTLRGKPASKSSKVDLGVKVLSTKPTLRKFNGHHASKKSLNMLKFDIGSEVMKTLGSKFGSLSTLPASMDLFSSKAAGGVSSGHQSKFLHSTLNNRQSLNFTSLDGSNHAVSKNGRIGNVGYVHGTSKGPAAAKLKSVSADAATGSRNQVPHVHVSNVNNPQSLARFHDQTHAQIKNPFPVNNVVTHGSLNKQDQNHMQNGVGGSGAGSAKSQPSGPVPVPRPQVKQPIAQGQGVSTGAKELTQPAQGVSEAPLFVEIDMQGLNAKQRKRLRRRLRKQKGKSVVVDKSPEVGTSGVQPELLTGTRGVQASKPVPTSNGFAVLGQAGGTEGPLLGPAGKLPPIPEGSERTPVPASSTKTDLDRPQQVRFSFTPLNPAKFMGPLPLGTPPCTPPSDRDSGDTQRVSPVVPGGPRRTGGRSYSDSDIPRADQVADLDGSGFETDQELYLDQQPVPASVSHTCSFCFVRVVFGSCVVIVFLDSPENSRHAAGFLLEGRKLAVASLSLRG